MATSDDGGKEFTGPLSGIRVLDVATFIAAPFCGTLMAEFGADVIKNEMPRRGDPLRELGQKYNGVGLIWSQENRNKKGITCDLRDPRGQEIIKRLVQTCDVLIENFTPGTMEGWHLGYEDIKAINPGLVMVRISAYGQTGPMSSKPGFGRVASAFGGITYLSGFPDRPPVNPGSPTIADYVAGLFAAFSVMVALEHRRNTGRGQYVDISLYESIFRLLDNLAAAYDRLGVVRERQGSLGHAVPHDHYPTGDGKWVAIACTTDAIFQRLTRAMGQADLGQDARYSTMAARVERREEVDTMVSEWTQTMDLPTLVNVLDSSDVPVSPINSIADIFEHPHIKARGTLVEISDPILGTIKMPGIVPRMSDSPGQITSLSPRLGQHNEEIYGDWLGFTEDEMDRLKEDGVI